MDNLPPELRNRLLRIMGKTPEDNEALRVQRDRIDTALDLLASLGVTKVVYRLDGGGDEGDTTLEEVLYADGHREESLPDVPVGFGSAGQVTMLAEELEGHAGDAPDIDWVNNDGGAGTVTYSPFGEDGERVEVEVYSHHEDEDEYDDQDEYDIGGGDE